MPPERPHDFPDVIEEDDDEFDAEAHALLTRALIIDSSVIAARLRRDAAAISALRAMSDFDLSRIVELERELEAARDARDAYAERASMTAGKAWSSH